MRLLRNLTNLLIFFIVSDLNLSASEYLRNTDIDVLGYSFDIEINDSTDIINGIATISVHLLKPATRLVFDLQPVTQKGHGMNVKYVRSDDRELQWDHKDDKLIIYSQLSGSSDTLKIQIAYSGIPGDGLIISRNRYGDRTFFSDHWPDRAHSYLPCIDHPYDKASVDFLITAPPRYNVVANGILKSEKLIDHNRRLTVWSEANPIPVKVMAFAAAEFAVDESSRINGIPVTSWVFPQNRAEGFYDYSFAGQPLAYFIDLLGPYPFNKLANVQSATIFGGLENASAVFYAESSVTGLGNAKQLIAHEITHQWFGNCVTEDEWHHLWLSEGFATYLTSMFFEELNGRENMLSDMRESRDRIIDYNNHVSKPVIDKSETDPMELLNVNTYQKGAWILHMLRNEIGDEAFLNGLRLFYTRFKFSNVVTEDFRAVMEEVSGKDLARFFKQWLYIGGQPELTIKIIHKNSSGSVIKITQNQSHLFEFDLELDLISADKRDQEQIPIRKKTTRYRADDEIISVVADPEVRLLYQLSH